MKGGSDAHEQRARRAGDFAGGAIRWAAASGAITFTCAERDARVMSPFTMSTMRLPR
jgi:hypothetical protein